MSIFELKYGTFFETRIDTELFLTLYTCFATDMALWSRYMPTFFSQHHAAEKKLSATELEDILTMVS